jgi:hypothetical protein
MNDFEVLSRADGETMANLRQDVDFMGAARSHQYALAAYLYQLHRLAETVDSIVALLAPVDS